MAVTRQVLFLIDPQNGISNTFSYTSVPDGNSDGKAFTCGFVPASKGTGTTVMQDVMFLGTTAAVGKTFRTFDDSLGQDGSDTITAEYITGRIDPDNRGDGNQGRDSTTKRYEWVDLNGPNLTEYNGSVYWLSDLDPVRSPVINWTQFQGSPGDTRFYFESGLANHVHLRGLHAGTERDKIHLSGFAIHYQTIGRGEGRDS